MSAFKEWLQKTHGIIPNTMEELNWSAQLKQAWNASGEHHTKKAREDTVKKCIEILENNQIFTATITNPIKIDEGNIKACAIDEIMKEFNYE